MGINQYIKIGSKIKEVRLSKGISQKEMAKRLSLPISTYSGYENNYREPQLDLIYKICNELGTTLDELLGASSERIAIGKNIQILRKKRELTLKELSKKTGIKESTIQEYEMGKYIPERDNIVKLAKALDVSIKEILSYGNMIGEMNQTGDIIYIDSDILEYNRIIKKQEDGDGFTLYDIRFVSDFIMKDTKIRESFVINGLKSREKNFHQIQNSYEKLNQEGKNEAQKRIEELTELPRYTVPDEHFKGSYSEEAIKKSP